MSVISPQIMNHERIEFNSIANMYETNRYEDAANAFEAFITEYGLTHEEITIFYNTFKRLSERYRENLRNIEEMLINFQGETKFEFLSDLQKYGLIEAESYSLLAVKLVNYLLPSESLQFNVFYMTMLADHLIRHPRLKSLYKKH